VRDSLALSLWHLAEIVSTRQARSVCCIVLPRRQCSVGPLQLQLRHKKINSDTVVTCQLTSVATFRPCPNYGGLLSAEWIVMPAAHFSSTSTLQICLAIVILLCSLGPKVCKLVKYEVSQGACMCPNALVHQHVMATRSVVDRNWAVYWFVAMLLVSIKHGDKATLIRGRLLRLECITHRPRGLGSSEART
jgi:hypothetical protein